MLMKVPFLFTLLIISLMRITCNTIDDFIENIRGEKLYLKQIFIERTSRPLNGTSKRDATSFEIYFSASAIIEYADGGQALLTAGVDCGIDRTTQDGDKAGTRMQDVIHAQLVEHCRNNDLKLKPGALDI